MIGGDVCVAVYADGPAAAVADVRAAASAQSAQPRVILDVSASLAGAVRRAGGESCDWVWLLDGCAVPEPGALQALLGAGRDGALLLASKVVDPQGRLHPDATPRHELFEKARSIEAAQRHLVQLRAAAPGSVLVATAALTRFAPPRQDLSGGLDMHEWSARMLRGVDDVGYLVPASVAVRTNAPRDMSAARWIARARVLTSSAWSPRERLWEGSLLAADALTAGRESARRACTRRAARAG